MGRFIVVALLVSSAAYADSSREPPVQFEVGLNTRRFAQNGDAQEAFRQGDEMSTADEAHSAVSFGLRFTRWLPLNMFAGIEGEVGKLDTSQGSNLAGAYGLFGAHGYVGPVSLGVEMASGWRTVRYSLGSEEEGKLIAEPRVRAQVWLNPRVTVGAAVGATLSERSVWMAGVYIGVHSLVFGQAQP